MLDKLLDNLKKSLPESLRKKMGAEETHDEESSEYSEEESEESHDTSANESEPAPEDKKKKQISMIIRVVVILGLGYLVLTEFVFKQESVEEVPTVAVRPRKPRKKVPPPGAEQKAVENTAEKTAETKPGEAQPAEAKPDEAKPDEAKTAETPQTEATDNKPESQTDVTKTEVVQAPVENINIADKAAEEKPAEKPGEQPIDETPIVKTPPAETAPQVGEVKSGEGQVDKSLDTLIDNMESGEAKPAETSKNASKLEDKIVADDVYTPPPAYDQLGRGLVYNCKDKFWACLDKTAYINCNKNMKWNKAHGKPAECAVQNVYNSDEDCNTVQKYNVSTSKPTTFCQ